MLSHIYRFCVTHDCDLKNAGDSPCGYCGVDDSELLYRTSSTTGRQYTLRTCRRCDAVFLAPRPNAVELADAYDSAYYGTESRKFVAPVERLIDMFRSSRARRVAKLLPAKGRVLDIGCGNGGFLSSLSEMGHDSYGIELPGGSAERALQVPNISVHVGTVEDGPYFGEQFDAVTMWHVFEHLVEPVKTLEIAAELLGPGGRLHLSLPNIDSWQSRVFKGDWLHNDPPRHLFFLGPESLVSEVEARGFRCESISHFSLEQNPFGIFQSVLNMLLPERDVLLEAMKGNREVTTRHSRRSLALQKAAFVLTYPLCAALAAIESAARRGGTMELVFVKTEALVSS